MKTYMMFRQALTSRCQTMRTFATLTAPHGMNRSAFLIKHRLQPLVAGAAELRSVVLVYEMNVLPPSLELPPHGLDGAGKGSPGGESGVPVGNGDVTTSSGLSTSRASLSSWNRATSGKCLSFLSSTCTFSTSAAAVVPSVTAH
mmetsp:Transcript_12600/g.31876  ORF Transcript_12600/g.31876 Transcript_12600/m.31876 type:complete len:144 (+) Transcript_12600:1837-2268(+)